MHEYDRRSSKARNSFLPWITAHPEAGWSSEENTIFAVLPSGRKINN